MAVFALTRELAFPSPAHAEENGLLAVGGDLSPRRLLLAYSLGIFPWYSEGQPILWWSPDPRLVLFPEELRISRSLGKTVRKPLFRVTVDTAFDEVISSCAGVHRREEGGTWLTGEMVEAYEALHRLGFAHSVECWQEETLAGGLYGVALGKAFFGESMFSTRPDASKVALVALVEELKQREFEIIDCQVSTMHLVRMGAREIPRDEFLQILSKAVEKAARPGKWESGEER
jgi:leucyl/phenylalanyl-tRNA--protein transferase